MSILRSFSRRVALVSRAPSGALKKRVITTAETPPMGRLM
jgi:phosphoribosyl-dephospho-CoA transferase